MFKLFSRNSRKVETSVTDQFAAIVKRENGVDPEALNATLQWAQTTTRPVNMLTLRQHYNDVFSALRGIATSARA